MEMELNIFPKILVTTLSLLFAGVPANLAAASTATNSDQLVSSYSIANLQNQLEVADSSVLDEPVIFLVDRFSVVGQIPGINSKITSSIVPMAAAGCSFRNAMFVTTSWVQTIDGCGIIGVSSTARWVYQWHTNPDAELSGPACMEGRGYYNTNGSIVRWYPSGCSNSGSVSVLIGNRATVAKMRGHVLYAASFAYVNWR